MTLRALTTPLAAAAVLIIAVSASAQTPEMPIKPGTMMVRPGQTASPATFLVEVTIARYKGETRLSAVPYTLAVSDGGPRSTLRVGGQVPVPSTAIVPSKEGQGQNAPQVSYSYRDIGTSLDVQVMAVAEGRYRVTVVVEETSIYPPAEAARSSIPSAGGPSFRSLRASNAGTLRNGQSLEFIAAPDRIDGETTRISAKLTVVN